MGDSMKWAAEKEEEEYRASKEGKANAAKIREWNKLATKLQKVIVRDFTFGELQRLQAFPTSLHEWSDRAPSDGDFELLRRVTASRIIDEGNGKVRYEHD